MTVGEDEGGVGMDERVVDVRECVEDCPEDRFRAARGHGHADLFPYLFQGAFEDEVCRKGLERRTLGVRERAVFAPMVHVRAAAARSRKGVGGAGGVEPPVDVAHARRPAVELDFGNLRADRRQWTKGRDFVRIPRQLPEVGVQLVVGAFFGIGEFVKLPGVVAGRGEAEPPDDPLGRRAHGAGRHVGERGGA